MNPHRWLAAGFVSFALAGCGVPGFGPPTGAPGPGQPVTSGSFPRSFLIPGTDTSIRIGGFANVVPMETRQGQAPASPYSRDSGADMRGGNDGGGVAAACSRAERPERAAALPGRAEQPRALVIPPYGQHAAEAALEAPPAH
jgi:hypothetical protein